MSEKKLAKVDPNEAVYREPIREGRDKSAEDQAQREAERNMLEAIAEKRAKRNQSQ